MTAPPTVARWIFVSFMVAFAIKAPLVPLHTWLPDTAEQASPGTSVLLIGVLDKIGTYGMIALVLPLFPEAATWAAPTMLVLAVIGIIYGGLAAIGQDNLYRLISYTSISHFGFMVLGIFIGSPVAATGAMVYMVAHGLSIAGLYLVTGFLARRTGTVAISELGGIARVMPLVAGTFLVSGLASIALPGLSGFVPEWMVLTGTFSRSVPLGIVAVAGVVIAAVYMLLPYQRVFTGAPAPERVGSADLDARERLVLVPVIAAMLALGLAPGVLTDALDGVAGQVAATMSAGRSPGRCGGAGGGAGGPCGSARVPRPQHHGRDQQVSFTVPTIEWAGLAPVLIILGAGVLGVLVEALVPRAGRLYTQAVLSALAVLGAGAAFVMRWAQVLPQDASTGQVVPSGSVLTPGISEDPFGVAAQGIMLVIGLLSVLIMADRTTAGDGAFAAQAADRPGSAEETESLHHGWTTTEVFPLTMFSLAGMMLFPMVNDFIALFVVLELISLPLYIMAATARHRRLLSQESALKYFVLGAFASAFLLLGSALLYGLSGSVSYTSIATRLAAGGGADVIDMDWLGLAGVALVTVGLLFKTAAAPFHAWSPDVYQGAPTPVTGFMAAGVKATAFLALLRFYYMVGGSFGWDMAPFLWTVAILTIAVGTVVGVVQSDVKRMLAYSAIAHAGYMLIGIIAFNGLAISALLLYALAYGAATVGAFGVVTLVRASHAGAAGAEATDLESFAGLGRRSPWLAGAMTVFLLSFAGVPLTAGFIAKFELFIAGVGGGALWLVIAAVVSSAITAFFYMRLVVLMFFRDPQEDRVVVVGSMGPSGAAITVAVFITVVLGVLPQAVLTLLGRAAMLLP